MATQEFLYRKDFRPQLPESLGPFLDRELEKIETAIANVSSSTGVVGPRGPQGPAGAPGATGPQGPPGTSFSGAKLRFLT